MARPKTEAIDHGSIEYATARLAVWARRAPGGLARVEYESEFARLRAITALRARLGELGIPFHEVELPRHQPAGEVVRFLVERLRALERGVVSISGFAAAFPDETPLADSLYVLNLNREKLALRPLCQIWWMPPALAQVLIHTIPDLNSWFMVRLRLTEWVRVSSRWYVRPTDTDRTRDEDGQRRASYLVERFERALQSDASLHELRSLAVPALVSLLDANADVEADRVAWELLLCATDRRAEARAGVSDAPDDLTLADWETALGTDHYGVPVVLRSLAGLWATDHPEFAASALRRAASIAEAQGDRFATAACLRELAWIYANEGSLESAEECLSRALELVRGVSSGADRLTPALETDLGILYEEEGRWDEAEAMYRSALRAFDATPRAEPAELERTLEAYAHLLNQMGAPEEAKKMEHDAATVRRERELVRQAPAA